MWIVCTEALVIVARECCAEGVRPLLGRWVVVVWRAVECVEGSLKVPSSHPRPEAHLA